MSLTSYVERISPMEALMAAGAATTFYISYKIAKVLILGYFSPVRDIPGPPSTSFIYGNAREVTSDEAQEEWETRYGKVILFKGLFGSDRLMTTDTKALNYILMHSTNFVRPEQNRYNISRLLGEGLLFAEGDKHKHQRRIMNPSFGPSSIKDLTPIFFRKAIELKDVLINEIAGGGRPEVEILSWLSRATLDVIGLAGFNYNFDSLNAKQKSSELNEALSSLLRSETTPWVLLRIYLTGNFPIFRYLLLLSPSQIKRAKKLGAARNIIRRIGEEVIHQRRSMLLGEVTSTNNDDSPTESRDLLSALIEANMDTDIPAEQRMSDEDVMAQVPTFLIAGHETTSTETTWCLYSLCQHPDVQSKLRKELRTVQSDTPTMAELEALPYLDAVVRETLRIHAVVIASDRVAVRDDVIPLEKPFVDKQGIVRHEIHVTKGQGILIPISALNKSKFIWGEDAVKFNPERWMHPLKSASTVPGVWGHILTFLGGARSCIGYRFALVEMKALLFTLLRTFEFELTVPADHIVSRSRLARPFIKGEEKRGARLPLLLKVIKDQ